MGGLTVGSCAPSEKKRVSYKCFQKTNKIEAEAMKTYYLLYAMVWLQSWITPNHAAAAATCPCYYMRVSSHTCWPVSVWDRQVWEARGVVSGATVGLRFSPLHVAGCLCWLPYRGSHWPFSVPTMTETGGKRHDYRLDLPPLRCLGTICSSLGTVCTSLDSWARLAGHWTPEHGLVSGTHIALEPRQGDLETVGAQVLA